MITRPTGDGVTILNPTSGPITVLVPEPGTRQAGTVQIADQSSGQIVMIHPDGIREPCALITGSPTHGAAAGIGTPRDGQMIWLDSATATAVVVHPAGDLDSSFKVGSNPVQVIVAPAGAPLAGTAYVLSAGDGSLEPGSITEIPPTGGTRVIATGPQPDRDGHGRTRNRRGGYSLCRQHRRLYTANLIDGTVSEIPPGNPNGTAIPVGALPADVQIIPATAQ